MLYICRSTEYACFATTGDLDSLGGVLDRVRFWYGGDGERDPRENRNGGERVRDRVGLRGERRDRERERTILPEVRERERTNLPEVRERERPYLPDVRDRERPYLPDVGDLEREREDRKLRR